MTFAKTKHLIETVIACVWEMLIGDTIDGGFRQFKGSRSLTEKFRGYCGFAQCVAGYAFQDLGLTVRPVATQSLDTYWHGHAALVVEATDGRKSKWFLVDPTFLQFCRTNPLGEEPSPGMLLSQSSEGLRILDELLENGFIELTPGRARIYLASFCLGICPLSEEEALAFFQNPPPHPYHFCYNPGDDRFSRDALMAKGLLVPIQKITMEPN